jgi:hypothetical protein
MRTSTIVAALALGLVGSAAAQDRTATGPRVRTANVKFVALIQMAAERSETFRTLVAAIDASNDIVYIEEGLCRHGVRACLIAVTATGKQRILRIRVSARAADIAVMATIGHELQHAIEVIGNPRVNSTEAMQQFYLRIGSRGLTSAIETREAVEAGRKVTDELRKHQQRPESDR